MKLSSKVQTLTDLITPAVSACDVLLWGVEFSPQGKRSLLRVYVDLPENMHQNASLASKKEDEKPKSVSVEDCMRVSHQISGLLDVYDPIAGEYVLEVSSPGWDRRFFKPEQLKAYVGETIAIRLIHAVENRRKMTGHLVSVSDDALVIKLADVAEDITVQFINVDKANLVYQD